VRGSAANADPTQGARRGDEFLICDQGQSGMLATGGVDVRAGVPRFLRLAFGLFAGDADALQRHGGFALALALDDFNREVVVSRGKPDGDGG